MTDVYNNTDMVGMYAAGILTKIFKQGSIKFIETIL